MKRIKIKPKKPNPLFELWLEEWMNEATSKNSDLQHHFAKALRALKKYPLPLMSGKDCIILKHFGSKLCSMLDRKLQEHRLQNKDSKDSEYVCINCIYNDEKHGSKRRKTKRRQIEEKIVSTQQQTELSVLNGIHTSSWGLENYAVLLALYNQTQDSSGSGYISEASLLAKVKKLSDNASKASILSLFDVGLVSMIGSPLRYSLTEQGTDIVKKICEITGIDATLVTSPKAVKEIHTQLHSKHAEKAISVETTTRIISETVSDVHTTIVNKDHELISNFSKPSHNQPFPSEESATDNNVNNHPVNEQLKESSIRTQVQVEVTKKVKHTQTSKTIVNKATKSKTQQINDVQKDIYLESNTFDIVLLVDTQEISGGKTKPQHDATISELSQLGVLFEVRHLKVGDFAWIARSRLNNNELVLPYIVERKRIDDLSASITDGRFHEQKFRLKQSGIANLMYIVEEYEKTYRFALPHSSLMQASINSLIQDGFILKYTNSHKDSMFYLSSLTRILTRIYKEKDLMGCKKENLIQTDILSRSERFMEFQEFNKTASKQKAFKVSQMFIRQLLQLKGMSVEKALAIVERYPTPRILIDTLHKSSSSKETLASIEFGDKKRLLGPAISKTIYQLYTNVTLN